MRAMLSGALALVLAGGAQAQTLPSQQPGLPPSATSPVKAPGLAPPTFAPALSFTTLPTGIVPLHGRDPGASVQIAAMGGKGPLSLAFNVDPASYASYFSLELALAGIKAAPSTLQQTIGPTPTPSLNVPSISQSLRFKGLPANQNLPSAPIHVFMRVSDSTGAVIEKTFDVRLTNSAALPVIDSAVYAGNPGDHVPDPEPPDGPYTIFEIHHHGFSLSEPGSYFECAYPTGIKYKCHQWNTVTSATVTTLLVPDINLGLTVSMRLVNDTGASAPVTLQLKNSKLSVTDVERVSPRGPVGTAFAQLDSTSPDAAAPYIANKSSSCGDYYMTWNSVSAASNVRPDQVLPVPAGVTLKKAPTSGSVMSSGNLPVWDWSVVLATGVSFSVTYEYTYRVGACEFDLVH